MVTGPTRTCVAEASLSSSPPQPAATSAVAAITPAPPNRPEHRLLSSFVRCSTACSGEPPARWRARRAVLALAEHEPGRRRRHLRQRLADRGQRRADPARHRQVVEADHAELGGDSTPLPRGLVDAERLEVGAGEDRGRRLGSVSSACPARSRPRRGTCPSAELRIDRQPRGLERGAVAVDARAAAQHRRRAADHADAPVPELEQVPRGGDAAVPVRRADRRHAGRRLARRVDDHERDAAGAQARRCSGSAPRRRGSGRRCGARPPRRPTCGPSAPGPSCAESTTPSPFSRATSSTPLTISIAHGLSSSLNTTSSSCGTRVTARRAAPVALLAQHRSTRSRVAGATSARPLTTFETVGTETPAASAMCAIVSRRSAAKLSDMFREWRETFEAEWRATRSSTPRARACCCAASGSAAG